MGCDIHSVAQVFKRGKWVTKIGRPGGDDRNYDSFAVLADVRNGSGFAGVKTGQGWPVIDEPRGLPDDLVFLAESDDDDNYISENTVETPPWKYEWQKKNEKPETSVWLGDHSHSWLLLSEIEEFVDKKIKGTLYQRVGILDKFEFARLEKGQKPKSWCGGISGPNVCIVSAAEARKGVEHTHIRATWDVPAMDCLYTLNKYLNILADLAAKEKVTHDKVRLVFGFDS